MTAVKKLPVWQTVYNSHAYVFRNIRLLASLAWPWLLLVAAIAGFSHWLTFDYRDQFLDLHTTAAWLLADFVSIISVAMVAVVIHRLLLLEKTPEPVVQQFRTSYFLNYLGFAILVWIMMVVPTLALMGAADSGFGLIDIPQQDQVQDSAASSEVAEPFDNSTEAWGLCLLCVCLVGTALLILCIILSYFPIRLSLSLPASAIGQSGNLVSQSWKWTRGNFLRLFFAMLVVSWPIYIATLPCLLVDNCEATRTAFWYSANAAFVYVMFAISAVLWASFLSFSYRHLVHDQPPISSNN